jgi:hypothetical protein
MTNIKDIITSLPSPPVSALPPPAYRSNHLSGVRVGLAVESMKRHMTDEGWQLFAGLERAGYALAGRRLPLDEVEVPKIINRLNPDVVVVQDKREWDVQHAWQDKTARFLNHEELAKREDIFKLTVAKDAHYKVGYDLRFAEEIGCHAWIVYYNPAVLCRVAPYLRPRHLVRTWHSVDASTVPDYSPGGRDGCLLSGAASGVYPLRRLLIKKRHKLPKTTYLPHPGYHANGCCTPAYLKLLSNFKVAICTASIYGYAFRKMIEATAAGCTVLTNLPEDERLPEIDGNLVRIDPNVDVTIMAELLNRLYAEYDPEKQKHYSDLAKCWYNYGAVGARLAADIEAARSGYGRAEA